MEKQVGKKAHFYSQLHLKSNQLFKYFYISEKTAIKIWTNLFPSLLFFCFVVLFFLNSCCFLFFVAPYHVYLKVYDTHLLQWQTLEGNKGIKPRVPLSSSFPLFWIYLFRLPIFLCFIMWKVKPAIITKHNLTNTEKKSK